jgi:hypothetical protein
MIRRLAFAAGTVVVSAVTLRRVARGIADRLVDAPRVLPAEAGMTAALDAHGGEVVRLRSRDGLRLAGRWLPGAPGEAGDWQLDPHEAILLLHGWSGSIAPDLIEYAPFLRRTAAVLGLDFGGHGDSDPAPTTFGQREVEDVAGALAWLGERGVRRVAMLGTSMGGITAIASIGVLGDGSLAGLDAYADPPRAPRPAPRPRIVAAVLDSVVPELELLVSRRIPGPPGRLVARLALDAVERRLRADPRATEPIRMIGLTEGVPLLLITGSEDERLAPEDATRLAAAAGPRVERWEVPGAGHSGGHATDPLGYEARVTEFLRRTFAEARRRDPIIGATSAGEAAPVAVTSSDDAAGSGSDGRPETH